MPVSKDPVQAVFSVFRLSLVLGLPAFQAFFEERFQNELLFWGERAQQRRRVLVPADAVVQEMTALPQQNQKLFFGACRAVSPVLMAFVAFVPDSEMLPASAAVQIVGGAVSVAARTSFVHSFLLDDCEIYARHSRITRCTVRCNTRVFAIRSCKSNEPKGFKFSKPKGEQKGVVTISNKNLLDPLRAVTGEDWIPGKRYKVRGFWVADAKTMYEGVQEDFRPVTPSNDAE